MSITESSFEGIEAFFAEMRKCGRKRLARDQDFADHRSLVFHHLVAQTIRQDPSKLTKVRQTIDAMIERGGHSLHYSLAWKKALDGGMESLLAMAVEDSERGRAMRQCMPFAGVVDFEVRDRFFKEWSEANAMLDRPVAQISTCQKGVI